MSIPEIDPLSDFVIPGFSTEDLPAENLEVDLPNREISEVALGRFYFVDEGESAVKFITTNLPERVQAIKSDKMLSGIKRIVDLSKKALREGKVGAAKILEKEGEVAIQLTEQEQKELEEYQRKGFKFVKLDISDKGELVEKPLNTRNIKYYRLSEEEHARILGVGLSALESLNQQIKERERQAKAEKEKGTDFFRERNVIQTNAQKRQRLLAEKILGSQKNEVTIAKAREKQIELEEEHNKQERTEKKDEYLSEKKERQVEYLKSKAEIRQEDEPPKRKSPKV